MGQFVLSPLDIAAIVYGVLTFIVLLIVFSILRRLIRKIGEIWSHANLFGMDPKTRLISLGIAALLFPRVIYSVANALIYFISNFFVEAPRSLLTNWLNAQTYCIGQTAESMRYCFAQLWLGFIQAWTSALSDAIERFGPGFLPYSQLILMLAVWAIVALLLSASPVEEEQRHDDQIQMRLHNIIERLSKPAKQNIMLFSILLLAGYLSIAAITAIPGLQEPAIISEAISAERLDEQLTEVMTQSQANITRPLELSDPFADVEEAPGAELDEITKGALNSLKVAREQLFLAHASLVSDAQSQAVGYKTSAVNTYRASLIDRKGAQQTVQHFLSIDEWFRRVLSRLESRINTCRTVIGSTNYWFENRIREIFNPQPVNIYQNINSSSPLDDAFTFCTQSLDPEPIPERPDLGSNLGPFSYVASWLLRTESLPLAQIVGLLGFGLLGSAVSTLVRSDFKKRRNQPLVEELATVIIRGATAAVVVFLAVKGGLAIFTAGESDPNSYVLLLTCLIAAVFSEDVWQEAHKRLNKGLGGAETPQQEESNEEEDIVDASNPDEESQG
jgi:hypothetical protein